jgi:hypothetical protein
MKNLALAVLGVMKDVKGMEKNSKVGAGTKSSYDGTKDQDVKEVFNEALAKHGLCMLPIDIKESTQIDRWEEEDPWSKSTPKARKQKQSVFTKVTTKYLLLHESGESLELAGYGHGIDSQDKGAGKATTYAMKNALLYSFVTPVGKMDDSETTHSDAITTPPAKTIDKKETNKPWLNKGTPEFTNAQSFLKGGGKIASVEAKYMISKETKQLLTK